MSTPTHSGDLLTTEDLITRYPGTGPRTWARYRREGTGPVFMRVGRRVLYRAEDVDQWERDLIAQD